MGENMGPADIKAVVDNNGYPYPYPYMGGYGNSGFGNGDWSWIIILLILCGGFGNYGGGFGGFGGFGNEYAWLSNGQKEIMQNTNQGFDTLQLSNQIEGTRDGIYGISNQICNSTSDIVGAINGGFSSAEIAANARQMANMQQNFDLSRQFADCCCENRLGIANLNSTILSENCADRAVLQEGVRDIITNQTANTQRILDQLCADKIDAKNEKIADLERQLTMADLKASQIAQTAQIQAGFVQANKDLYELLDSCPIGTTPVYRKNSDF